MQQTIIDTMKKSGRLRVNNSSDGSASRFDKLDEEYINSASDDSSEEMHSCVSDDELEI